uniref:ATP-dependent DNA helicase n=1 Tax=Trichogramma kaykai TaxID=54128 RepID=A0ABD2X6C2_9HYME
MIRQRKLKHYKTIEELPEDSEEIFCDDFVDTHYPNRPLELETLSLYEFAKWFDIQKQQPSSEFEYYPMLGKTINFCKKREIPFIINHWKYKVDTQSEDYFYALLLLFKPWRDCEKLIDGCRNYTEAFAKSKEHLPEALKYHEKVSLIDIAVENAENLAAQETEKLTGNEEPKSQYSLPVDCLTQKIDRLNEDQRRIFDQVTRAMSSGNETSSIIRSFISGSGGTGKSFLIEILVKWNKIVRENDTAVAAPTGLAAYNVNGLTIHRLLHLPVEQDGTAKYKPLSDSALKTVRSYLNNVNLLIVDEVSMISNITLLYMHLRLTEVFDSR